MSKSNVATQIIDSVQAHPNADRLDVATVSGYSVIVGKGSVTPGQVVVYFPPDNLIPESVADELGVKKYMKHALYPGDLERSQCRIGAARLRGIASFGFLIPTTLTEVDVDLTEVFKAVRYEPPIKAMQGDQIPEVSKFHRYTEIENVQRHAWKIPEGTPVVYTEKIHGANCRIGVIDGEIVAGSHRCQSSSSGMGIYWTPWPICHDLLSDMQEDGTDIIIFGEVYGPSIQNLSYDTDKVKFRCFDISINGNYLPYRIMRELCDSYNIPRVPALAMGKYSRETLNELTDGTSLLASHIREGVVVKALEESVPRQILKSVSVDYLSR